MVSSSRFKLLMGIIKKKPGILVTRDQQTNNATQYDKMIINNAAQW